MKSAARKPRYGRSCTIRSLPAGSHPEPAIQAVWRIESARIIGALVRMLKDLGQAEELAQDALVAALERWPKSGVPDNPGAWLMATARRRAIDQIRRGQRLAHKQKLLVPEPVPPPEFEEMGDDVLRLMFATCHPVLSTEARVSLTLRLLGGLTTAEIARAFLVPEPTVAQRIVRAKRTLVEARASFDLPGPAEREGRLDSVLEVIYLIFNEGYSATAGDDWVRPELCDDAMRLGRILAARVDHGEVQGLVALMELQASRLRARTGPDGAAVRLLDQDRSRWDWLLIERGLATLDRIPGPYGPYAIQAALAACHARARVAADTDWPRMVALYDALFQLQPSPVIALNRAVAVAMAFGPEAGLEALAPVMEAPALQRYHLLPATRADFLWRLGRKDEARRAFEHAATLTQNAQEQRLLLSRAQQC